MDTWQAANQIKFLMEERLWDGTGDKVFPDIRVTAGVPDRIIGELRFPFGLVMIGAFVSDDEDPDLIFQTFNIGLVVESGGDPFGEASLIGTNRQSLTNSDGRGLLEVERELKRILNKLQGQNGVNIQIVGGGGANGALVNQSVYVAAREYAFVADLTVEAEYPAPLNFRASLLPSTVLLSWKNPSDRYDFHATPTPARGGLVLRRAAGDTPPAGPTDGTGLPVNGFDESIADTPGAGTFSYSLFAGYDETESGTNQQFSPAATVSGVVVT